MADISKIKVGETEYDVKDATASNSNLASGVMYLESLVFFNCVLTGAQHLQLATQINAL